MKIEGKPGEIAIKLPKCEKGIGDVILATDSPKLIAGVICAPFAVWPDDRGYFLEVQRIGVGTAGHFPKESTQVSAAVNYPGIVKAFHFHRHQTDWWTPATACFRWCWPICGPNPLRSAGAIRSTWGSFVRGRF